MMKISKRLAELAEQAERAGGRLLRVGSGGFVLIHAGQRHELPSLREVKTLLRHICGGAA